MAGTQDRRLLLLKSILLKSFAWTQLPWRRFSMAHGLVGVVGRPLLPCWHNGAASAYSLFLLNSCGTRCLL